MNKVDQGSPEAAVNGSVGTRPAIVVHVDEVGEDYQVGLEFVGDFHPLMAPTALEIASKIARNRIGLS